MYKKRVHTSFAIRLAQIVIFCALFVVQAQARFFTLSSRFNSGSAAMVISDTSVPTIKSLQEKTKPSVKKLKLNKRYQSSDVLAVLPSGATPFYFVFFNRYTTVIPSVYLPAFAGNPALLRGPPAAV